MKINASHLTIGQYQMATSFFISNKSIREHKNIYIFFSTAFSGVHLSSISRCIYFSLLHFLSNRNCQAEAQIFSFLMISIQSFIEWSRDRTEKRHTQVSEWARSFHINEIGTVNRYYLHKFWIYHLNFRPSSLWHWLMMTHCLTKWNRIKCCTINLQFNMIFISLLFLRLRLHKMRWLLCEEEEREKQHK